MGTPMTMEALSSHPTPPWFRPGLAPGTLALGLDIRLGSRKNRGRTTGVTAIKKKRHDGTIDNGSMGPRMWFFAPKFLVVGGK